MSGESRQTSEINTQMRHAFITIIANNVHLMPQIHPIGHTHTNSTNTRITRFYRLCPPIATCANATRIHVRHNLCRDSQLCTDSTRPLNGTHCIRESFKTNNIVSTKHRIVSEHCQTTNEFSMSAKYGCRHCSSCARFMYAASYTTVDGVDDDNDDDVGNNNKTWNILFPVKLHLSKLRRLEFLGASKWAFASEHIATEKERERERAKSASDFIY